MKPKQTTLVEVLFTISICALILYIMLQFSLAYGIASKEPVLKNGKETYNYELFFDEWGKGFSSKLRFEWDDENSPKIMLWTVLAEIGVLIWWKYDKKHYINESMYGTSKWGKPKVECDAFMVKKYGGVLKHNKRLMHHEYLETRKSIKKEYSIIEIRARKNALSKRKQKYKNDLKYQKRLMENQYIEYILAKEVRICIYTYAINLNMLILGGSGAGKTRYVVMPTVLNLAGSVSFVITDPKGEVYNKTRYFLEEVMLYDVKCLDLLEIFKSMRYNSFSYIHTERKDYDWQTDALEMIDGMYENLDGGQGRRSQDPFWDDSPKMLITAVVFLIIYAFKKEQQNWITFMSLMHMLELEEDDDYDCPLDRVFRWFVSPKEEGGAGFSSDNVAYLTYKDFRSKCTGKTAKSISTIISSKFLKMDMDGLRHLASGDDMNLDEIGERKMAIFIKVPPMSKTFNFIAGMFFTQFMIETNYCGNVKHGGRLPVPIAVILDEFANTCIIPNFPRFIAYSRSLGMGIMPILQAREQLETMYGVEGKKDHITIEDNCSTIVLLGNIESGATLKDFSENKLGKGTFDVYETSMTKGATYSNSKSEKKHGRELMTPDEIGRMPPEDCLIKIKGRYPLYCHKYDYVSHPNYKYTSDYDKSYIDILKKKDEQKKLDEQRLSEIKENMDNDIEKYEQKFRTTVTAVKFEGTDIERTDDKEKELLELRIPNMRVASDDINDANGSLLSTGELEELFNNNEAYTLIYEDAKEDMINDFAETFTMSLKKYKKDFDNDLMDIVMSYYEETELRVNDVIREAEKKELVVATDEINTPELSIYETDEYYEDFEEDETDEEIDEEQAFENIRNATY